MFRCFFWVKRHRRAWIWRERQKTMKKQFIELVLSDRSSRRDSPLSPMGQVTGKGNCSIPPPIACPSMKWSWYLSRRKRRGPTDPGTLWCLVTSKDGLQMHEYSFNPVYQDMLDAPNHLLRGLRILRAPCWEEAQVTSRRQQAGALIDTETGTRANRWYNPAWKLL